MASLLGFGHFPPPDAQPPDLSGGQEVPGSNPGAPIETPTSAAPNPRLNGGFVERLV